ncbi:MAG TPA: hypothetical protein VM365_09705, partial [Gemmatimonadales bacterium]|nr:hypothetical protein [Gemmatimonadales bacterium]
MGVAAHGLGGSITVSVCASRYAGTGCQSTLTASRAARTAVQRQTSLVSSNIGSRQPASRATPQSVKPVASPTRSPATSAEYRLAPPESCRIVSAAS